MDANSPDRYVSVGAKALPGLSTDPVVPEDLRTPDVPYLGKDQEELLRKAVASYPDRINRIKWLRAIQHLRAESKTGWVIEGGKKKWGNPETTKASELNHMILQ